uniref:Uncharacterized protein n=1 Tax=Glossina pallidipes TaxID=7398 RepID=A0A1B0A653_GLOPL
MSNSSLTETSHQTQMSQLHNLVTEIAISEQKRAVTSLSISAEAASQHLKTSFCYLRTNSSIKRLRACFIFTVNQQWNSGKPFERITSDAQIADGATQRVEGYIKTKIAFRGEEKPFLIFIIPSLSRSPFLDYDFWKSFNIVRAGFIIELSMPLFQLPQHVLI